MMDDMDGQTTDPIEKLDPATPDLSRQNAERIAELFPEVVTEGPEGDGPHIDFDLLRQALSNHLVEGPAERYRLDWPGKRQAMLLANTPTTKTLRPVREDSVDFDTTRNLFIEGDNLEALKILQETYLGKVKMIYIDPPYNTGKDFVYRDNFRRSASKELEASGQADEEGQLVANTEANGRFHSDWLSMIAPRLKLARSLLRDDGFFVVSCDDTEVANLTNLANEIFGEANSLAVLVWDRNRKNDAKYFSVGHEYMLCFCKSEERLKSLGIKLRAKKTGVDEAREVFNNLRASHDKDWKNIQKEYREFLRTIPKGDDREPIKRFSKVDEFGPYRDDGDISWPGGNGPVFDVPHPVTGENCKVPSRGWVFSSLNRLMEEYAAHRVSFGADESTVPTIRSNLFEATDQVMRSVNYSYAQTSAVEFQDLFDGKVVFENPKNFRDLSELIGYMCTDGDVIADFFAGSGTTLHGAFHRAAFGGAKVKVISVQLDEATGNAVTEEMGFKTISQLSRERIRRAGAKIIAENPDVEATLDVGFRAFRIDSSNFHDTHLTVADAAAVATDDAKRADLLDGLTSHIKDDRSDEDLLFGALLAWGVDITLPVRRDTVKGRDVLLVDATEGGMKGTALIACFARDVDTDFAAALAALKPLRVVFRDDGFVDDATKENVASRFQQLAPDTTLRVL